jgi:hypothetical protein
MHMVRNAYITCVAVRYKHSALTQQAFRTHAASQDGPKTSSPAAQAVNRGLAASTSADTPAILDYGC